MPRFYDDSETFISAYRRFYGRCTLDDAAAAFYESSLRRIIDFLRYGYRSTLARAALAACVFPHLLRRRARALLSYLSRLRGFRVALPVYRFESAFYQVADGLASLPSLFSSLLRRLIIAV